MNEILTANKVSKQYSLGAQQIPVLHEVNLTVKKGEFISIMGPSGSGKSTLLYLLGGLDAPSSGEVFVNGKNIADMSDKEKSVMRRTNMGFVFQFYNLVQNLTIKENILLPS